MIASSGWKLELRRRLVNGNRKRPMWVISLGPNGYAKTLEPDALSQFLHILLTAEKSVFALVSFEDEAFEVTEMIEDQASDLARVSHALLRTWTRWSSFPWL